MKYQIVPVTHFSQNCSIVWCENTKKAAIVDPGGDADVLQQVIETLDIIIDKIILTHGHLDHVGAAQTIAQHYHVEIYGPQIEDKILLDNLPHQCVQFGFPFIQPFEPDHWLTDGEQIHVGDISFDVIHCPGHTQGHIVLVNVPQKIAFVGDVLFKNSIGRTDFPGGSYPALMDSIKRKLLPLGDDIVFVSGHGEMSSFGAERIDNPFLK